MKNILKSVLLLLVPALLIGLYVIKVETWQLGRKARKLERQIKQEERDIAVLRADLAWLSRPKRIEKLARKHLHMHPPSPDQIIVLKE